MCPGAPSDEKGTLRLARIPLLDATSAEGDAAKVLASSIGHMGVFRALAHAPANVLPALRLGRSILAQQRLDGRRRELVILLAMRLEGGSYEWSQHVEIALGVGATQAEIEALELLRLDEACFDPADRALLAFGRAMVEDVRVPEQIFNAARVFFEPQELVEATVAIGYYMMLARVTEALKSSQTRCKGWPCSPRLKPEPRAGKFAPSEVSCTFGCRHQLNVIRRAILALTQFWCSRGHVAPIRRA